eukprot:scaffold39375_cov87-Attheya_sp.AAC.1
MGTIERSNDERYSCFALAISPSLLGTMNGRLLVLRTRCSYCTSRPRFSLLALMGAADDDQRPTTDDQRPTTNDQRPTTDEDQCWDV